MYPKPTWIRVELAGSLGTPPSGVMDQGSVVGMPLGVLVAEAVLIVEDCVMIVDGSHLGIGIVIVDGSH